jgi:hypothetical protein
LSFSRADNGSAGFYARAFDAAGNAVNSSAVTVTVAIPDEVTVAIISSAAVQAVAGSFISFVVEATVNGVAVENVTITGASSQTGVFAFADTTVETGPNGRATFVGTINSGATVGQISTITFTYQSASATGSVLVLAAGVADEWVTVFRNDDTWVQQTRD